MARIFIVDGREFPDPDPTHSVDEVKTMFASFFPEVANAEVKQTTRGEDTLYEFVKRVGIKGIKMGSHRLVVTVQCAKCQTLLYRYVWTRSQSKGGRWDGGIHIGANVMESHDCKEA